jgi:hypothetical protein
MESITRKRLQQSEENMEVDSDNDATPRTRTRSDAKPYTKNVNTTSTRNQASKATPSTTPASRKVAGSKEALRNSFEDTAAFLLLLVLDITKMVLQLMKQPMYV